MQKAVLARTVIGFVVGGLMTSIIGLSYGFTIHALPLTGCGESFVMVGPAGLMRLSRDRCSHLGARASSH